MDQLDCLLQELTWDRQHLQGRNHLWRSESDNPVPGSTILEDRKRQAQSITDAKLQAAVLKEKQRRGPTAQTKIDAVVRFESLIHDHHFGGLIKQVDQVLNDRVQLKKFYDEYRKEQVGHCSQYARTSSLLLTARPFVRTLAVGRRGSNTVSVHQARGVWARAALD